MVVVWGDDDDDDGGGGDEDNEDDDGDDDCDCDQDCDGYYDYGDDGADYDGGVCIVTKLRIGVTN